MTILLLLAAGFLAYSNGANDNCKGVASLFGSGVASYRTAIWWATATTFAGSVCSIYLAQTLLSKFSGKGLVPDATVSSTTFILAVAIGAGATVILATVTGFPISTTHGLTGAMVGSGLVAAGAQVNFAALQSSFVLPLLVSPLLALTLGALLYLGLRLARLRLGITKEWCICIGQEERLVAIPQPTALIALQPAPPKLSVSVGVEAHCTQKYAGSFFGTNCQKAVDAVHFFSAGLVSFARGLNDTPKIAALLLIVQTFNIQVSMVMLALAMAGGGLLNARRVADTMSHRITGMNSGQGLAANLATGMLVVMASRYGLPVSTTHVSVGALFGIGLTTRQANYRVGSQILMSWLMTLPCAAAIAAAVYWFANRFV